MVGLPEGAEAAGSAGDLNGKNRIYGITADAYRAAQQRAPALAESMTREEKVKQLNNGTPPIPRLNLPAYNYWTEAPHGLARGGLVTSFPVPLAPANSWCMRICWR